MRLVAIESVEPGSVLARDVWGASSGVTPLLRAGTVLRDDYRDKLNRGGISAVYIEDELSAGIDVPTPLRATTHIRAGRVLEAAFTSLPGAVAAASGPLRSEVVLELKSVVRAIIEDLEDSGDAMLAFTDLATADAYTMQHSIDVAVLGLVIGRRLFQDYGWLDYDGTRRYDRIDERLTRLGLGLLLHDIGKVTVPTEVLNKTGPLDDNEWELIRAYPIAGAGMVTDDSIGARAKSVIRFHHERWDGTGYPHGLKGEAIPQLARIAAVADVFDAITSVRPYRIAAPAHVGVEEITKGSRTLFDPEVVSVFRALVAPHPAGTYVKLSDGREGIVSHVPPQRADRPTIRVVTAHDGTRLESPIEVSLARHPELEILDAGWSGSGKGHVQSPAIHVPGGLKKPPAGAAAAARPELPEQRKPAESHRQAKPGTPANTTASAKPGAAAKTGAPAEADPPRRQPPPAKTPQKAEATAEAPARTAPADESGRVAARRVPGDQVMTDELTGLGRRGQLDVDLNRALSQNAASSLLVVFDLDGTGLEKPMSRVRGEALLRELANTLVATLGDDADCYRSREVELSALIYLPLQPAMQLAKQAAAALGANEMSSVKVVNFGAAVLPEEAHEPLDAIKLADRRRKYPTLPPPGSGVTATLSS